MDRVQNEFNPEDMTPSRLQDYLYHGERGKHMVKWGVRKGEQRYKEVEGKPLSSKTKRLASVLSETSKLYNDIDKLRDVSELDYPKLKERTEDLYVHNDVVLKTLDKKTEELVEESVFVKLIGQASKDITEKEVTSEEYKEMWHTDRSTYFKIYWRMRALR